MIRGFSYVNKQGARAFIRHARSVNLSILQKACGIGSASPLSPEELSTLLHLPVSTIESNVIVSQWGKAIVCTWFLALVYAHVVFKDSERKLYRELLRRAPEQDLTRLAAYLGERGLPPAEGGNVIKANVPAWNSRKARGHRRLHPVQEAVLKQPLSLVKPTEEPVTKPPTNEEPMTTAITLTYVENTPLVLDKTLAECLKFERPRRIRGLIKRMVADGELPNVLTAPHTVRYETLPGRWQNTQSVAYYLTRDEALKVLRRCRTKTAASMIDAVMSAFAAAPILSTAPPEEAQALNYFEATNEGLAKLSGEHDALVHRVHALEDLLKRLLDGFAPINCDNHVALRDKRREAANRVFIEASRKLRIRSAATSQALKNFCYDALDRKAFREAGLHRKWTGALSNSQGTSLGLTFMSEAVKGAAVKYVTTHPIPKRYLVKG